MNAADFYKKYEHVARMVSAGTGIPVELELAYMSYETGFAKNLTYKDNNMTGITKGSSGKDYVARAYAGYNSLESYAKDRIRLLNKNFAGYPKIIAAAKGGKSYEEITKAHNASQWSEQDYNMSAIISRANAAKAVIGSGGGFSDGGKPSPKKVCPTCQRAL